MEYSKNSNTTQHIETTQKLTTPREEISGRKRRWGFKNHVKFEKNRFFFIFVKTLAIHPDGSKSLPKHPRGPKDISDTQ